MLYRFLLTVLLCTACVHYAEASITSQDLIDMAERDYTEAELARKEAAYKSLLDDIQRIRRQQPTNTAPGRQKRQYAYLFALALATGAQGYLLLNTITGGCTNNPSLCRNRDIIIRLTHEIEEMKANYESNYTIALADYIDLRESLYVNDYIFLYAKASVADVSKSEAWYKKITAEMTVRLTTLAEMANNGSMTSREFLNDVLALLSQGVADVHEMIDSSHSTTYKPIAINIAANMYFCFMLKVLRKLPGTPNESLKGLTDVTLDASELSQLGTVGAVPTEAQYRLLGSKVKQAWTSFAQQLHSDWGIVKRIFTSIADRPFTYVRVGEKRGGSYVSHRNVFNNFKAAMIDRFTPALTTLRDNLENIRDDKWDQFSVARFTFTWSQTISTGVLSSISVLETFLDHLKWTEAEQEMENLLNLTQQYHTSLTNQRLAFDNDQIEMQTLWASSMTNFRDISTAFTDTITDASTPSDITETAFELSNPVLSPSYFTGLDKTSINSKQSVAVGLFKTITEEFDSGRNEVRARRIFYSKINTDYKAEKALETMYTALNDVMINNAEPEVKQFGQALTTQDVLCFIALAYHNERVRYDSFLLSSMLPLCDVTPSQWEAIVLEARNDRYTTLMTDWIQTDIATGNIPISGLLDSVKRTFHRQSNTDMTSFANSLTEKEILCVVASLTEAAEYDFYELSLYRVAQCSAISSTDFMRSKAQADSNRAKVDDVLVDMRWCDRRPTRCDCPAELASFHEVSLDELTQLMRLAQPQKSRYCGSSNGCSPKCIDLS